MALEKGKAIIEIDLEGVFPLEISGVADRREFAFPEWGLERIERFHRRPSFTISSIIFTTLRGGLQSSNGDVVSSTIPSQKFAPIVVNMNVARRVIAFPPNKNVTAPTYLAHGRTYTL